MTGLGGRARSVGSALIILAGLAIPVATQTTATAATTATVQGTDVSNLTQVTSWPDVKAVGMTFVGIEAIQGESIPNKQYDSQVTGAMSAGLYVMPYVFADPGKIAVGGTQFSDAWNIINGTGTPYARGGLMLPIVLDMESDPINFPGEPCYGLTQTAMKTWIQEFVTADVSQTGAAPIIYTDPSWWASCIGTTNPFSKDPLWIANYGVSKPALPAGWNNDTFWQYTNNATISGITGAADLDYLGPVVQASQAGSAIGPVQLNTLSSLAGQSVSYSSSSGLPQTLTMSSSGQITGTPATIGRYTVGVTASSGVPSALTFTWDVHGSISVTSPGNLTTTAGSPVWLRVKATDQDGPDYPPSFAASGLPPGLSVGSYGIISGWPYKPGTYRVTVYVSDGLYAAGSTSFTWTVNAAPDVGATGPIRQWGGSGKCLDDAGYGTTNGNAVDLWSCTGRWNQSWTIAPDSTIHVGGKCLDVRGEGTANGTQLQLWTCNSGDPAQQWVADSDSRLLNPQSGKCLYVPPANAPNGTRVVIYTCNNYTNAHWLRPAANIYSGDFGRCLAISGSTAVLAGCANTGTQHWLESWNGNLQLGTRCLTETGTAAGSGLTMTSCSRTAPVVWQLRPVGPVAVELVNTASHLCATAPTSIIGVKLVIEPCAATQAATWHVS